MLQLLMVSTTDTCGHACAVHKPLKQTPQVPSKICMHAMPSLRKQHRSNPRADKEDRQELDLATSKASHQHRAKRATKTGSKNRSKTAGLQANEDLRKEVLQEEPQDVSTRCHGRNPGEWGMPKTSAAEQALGRRHHAKAARHPRPLTSPASANRATHTITSSMKKTASAEHAHRKRKQPQRRMHGATDDLSKNDWVFALMCSNRMHLSVAKPSSLVW